MRPRRVIVGFASLLLLGLLAMAYVIVPPVSERQLQTLPSGCSTNQVLVVLGHPTRVLQQSGQEIWEYSSWYSFRTLQFVVSGNGQCSAFHWEP